MIDTSKDLNPILFDTSTDPDHTTDNLAYLHDNKESSYQPLPA